MANSDPEAIMPETAHPAEEVSASADAASRAAGGDAAVRAEAETTPPVDPDSSEAQPARPERPRIQPMVILPRAARYSPMPPPRGFVRRYAPASAAVLLLAFALVGARLLVRHGTVDVSVASALPPVTAATTLPTPDRDQQLAQVPAEISSLAATVEMLRSKIDTMQAGADKMSASVDILRANLDRGHLTEDGATLRKSIDALKLSLAQTNSATSAQLGQLAQKLDRANPDVAGKLAQVADHLDRLERDQTARLAQIGARLDRLERPSTTSADVTGSIAKATPPPPAAVPAPLPSPKQQTVPDLRVLGVGYGAAMIENRNGAVFHVAQGDYIPGLGRVQSIERRGRAWYVVTAHGTIEPLSR